MVELRIHPPDPLQSPIRIKAVFFDNLIEPPLASLRPQKIIGTMPCPANVLYADRWFQTNPFVVHDMGESEKKPIKAYGESGSFQSSLAA